jgi:hypothetical protein
VDQHVWNAVDAYISEWLLPQDAVLDAVLQTSAAAGLPATHVAPNQGKLLMGSKGYDGFSLALVLS